MSENLVHLIFDLETLGKRENTVILSIAVVPFTFEDHDYFASYLNHGFMVKFDVADQIKRYSRSVDPETVEWWKKQDKEVRDINIKPSPQDFKVVEGLTKLSRFIGSTGYDYQKSYVWSRGSNFDFPKLEHFYEVSAGLKAPFNTWKIRDTRTFFDVLCGRDDGQYELRFGIRNDEFHAHNCLHDAAMEAAKMNEVYYLESNPEEIPF